MKHLQKILMTISENALRRSEKRPILFEFPQNKKFTAKKLPKFVGSEPKQAPKPTIFIHQEFNTRGKPVESKSP